MFEVAMDELRRIEANPRVRPTAWTAMRRIKETLLMAEANKKAPVRLTSKFEYVDRIRRGEA